MRLTKFASILFLGALAMAQSASAQFQGQVYEQHTSIVVNAYSQQKLMPWTGGANNPQFGMADLNHDNKLDLVYFERGTAQFKTFINNGTPGNPQYTYAPKYEKNLPFCNEYFRFGDYDRDGITDLFAAGEKSFGNTGFAAFKGYYNNDNELTFAYFKNLYYTDPFSGSINAYSQPSDIPGIVDMDGDGDIDFLGYNVGGSWISYYQNCQVEDGLPTDSIRICLKGNCWGKIAQGFDRTHLLHFNCSTIGQTCKGCEEEEEEQTRHQGNTMCFFDLDGDGDKDYLNGGISFSDIQYLKNGKIEYGNTRDTIIAQDTFWKSLVMPQWPGAFAEDVDLDGDTDVLISPHAEVGSENYKCIMLVKNTGTASAPVYTYQSDTFLIDQMIDAGSGSYPVLYDYNRDGKLDLFVGSDGYFQTGGTLRSRISYYRNTTTNTTATPSFILESNDLLNLNAINQRGAALAMGDLDNDGKDDLVIGKSDGTVSFYQNTAGSNAIQPVWTLTTLNIQDTANNTIDVGNFAAPCIYDVDKDGKKDLVIGKQNGYLSYYRNTGTVAGTMRLKMEQEQLGNVKADPQSIFSGYSTPYIGRTDNAPLDYLVMGSETGALYRFSGFQNGNTTNPYVMVDSIYSSIDVGLRSAPAIGDINGDNKYDMIVGNQLGGLTIYKQVLDVNSVAEVHANNAHNLLIYPNPASNVLYASWNKTFSGEQFTVTVYSIMGQKLYNNTIDGSENSVQISLDNYASGSYFCEITNGTEKMTQRFTIVE